MRKVKKLNYVLLSNATCRFIFPSNSCASVISKSISETEIPNEGTQEAMTCRPNSVDFSLTWKIFDNYSILSFSRLFYGERYLLVHNTWKWHQNKLASILWFKSLQKYSPPLGEYVSCSPYHRIFPRLRRQIRLYYRTLKSVVMSSCEPPSKRGTNYSSMKTTRTP